MIKHLCYYFILVQLISETKVEYTFVVTDRIFGVKSKEIVKLKLPDSNVLDIDFYKTNFPDIVNSHVLPRDFMRTKSETYSDTTIFYDSSGKLINDLNLLDGNYLDKNWFYTCRYDKEFKLINYKYSGCSYCSTSVYDMYIYYNENNEIIKLENQVNRRFEYLFIYDIQGEIICVKNKEDKETLKVKLKKKKPSD